MWGDLAHAVASTHKVNERRLHARAIPAVYGPRSAIGASSEDPAPSESPLRM